MWTNPIFDRTQTDILLKTPKAYFNATDLNRIESNCAHLANIFKVTVPTRLWSRTDFPTAAEFARIRNNILALRDAFVTYRTTPPTPALPLSEYSKVNDIEQILNDLYRLYEDNLQALTYAGEISSGETIGVI